MKKGKIVSTLFDDGRFKKDLYDKRKWGKNHIEIRLQLYNEFSISKEVKAALPFDPNYYEGSRIMEN